MHPLPGLTNADDNDFFFRIPLSDIYQGIAGADIADYLFGIDQIAVVGISNMYVRGISTNFTSAFLSNDPDNNVVFSKTYEEFQTNLTELAIEIKEANPEGIYMITFHEDGAELITELRELGVNVPIIGIDALVSPIIFDKLQNEKYVLGLIATSIASNSSAEFNSRYRERYQSDPIPYAPNAYDATMIAGKAIIAANDTVGISVKNQIREVGTNYQGVSGNITFDEFGDNINGEYAIYQVQNTTNALDLIRVGTWKTNHNISIERTIIKYEPPAITVTTSMESTSPMQNSTLTQPLSTPSVQYPVSLGMGFFLAIAIIINRKNRNRIYK
ncbi:MAG: hypothetical protein D6732_06365 [Methanobacteriota archaeon]|nr:MAG: hypothetical protein D6732_06365 [Euryarchaeota archaeon]